MLIWLTAAAVVWLLLTGAGLLLCLAARDGDRDEDLNQGCDGAGACEGPAPAPQPLRSEKLTG